MLRSVSIGAKLGNYSLSAQQFMRALRGGRSQRAFAMRLGYKGNPVTDWEHGRRMPTISEALRAAELTGIDVQVAFRSFHPAPLSSVHGQLDIAAWMEAVRGSTRTSEVAKRSRLSRHAIGRWLRGDSQPRIHHFFAYLDATTSRLYDWVAAMVPIEEVPCLRSRYERARSVRSATTASLWAEAVLRAIELPAYASLPRHRVGALAQILGLTIEQETEAIAGLRKAGAIQMRGGLFRCIDPTTVDMRGEPQRLQALMHHWMTTAASRFEERSVHDFFAYSLSALSAADVTQAREILRRAFREIRSLARTSEPSEHVLLVNLQLLVMDQNLDEPRAAIASTAEAPRGRTE